MFACHSSTATLVTSQWSLPMVLELVINLNTAKQIGVTIPQSVLYRADKVIQ
jgi:ABC-type uncharacterized transport system substrate-binding protein